MSRSCADPVEVLRRNDEPAHFLWRSRLYVVRGVLAHWVETGQWWSSATTEALAGVEPGGSVAGGSAGAVAGGDGVSGGGASRATLTGVAVAVHEPATAVTETAPPGADGVAAEGPAGDASGDEREIWRVEASSGRSGPAGVFELCFDWSSAAWTLVRTAD